MLPSIDPFIHTHKQIWGVAHRILLPAFSNQGMKQYFHIVQDCITRLFDKVGAWGVKKVWGVGGCGCPTD